MDKLITYYRNGFRFKLIPSDLRDYLNLRVKKLSERGKFENESRRKNQSSK